MDPQKQVDDIIKYVRQHLTALKTKLPQQNGLRMIVQKLKAECPHGELAELIAPPIIQRAQGIIQETALNRELLLIVKSPQAKSIESKIKAEPQQSYTRTTYTTQPIPPQMPVKSSQNVPSALTSFVSDETNEFAADRYLSYISRGFDVGKSIALTHRDMGKTDLDMTKKVEEEPKPFEMSPYTPPPFQPPVYKAKPGEHEPLFQHDDLVRPGAKRITHTAFQKMSYVAHCPGHRNSKGELAEWCVKSHETDKILSSHKTKQKAKEHLQQMHIHKGGSDLLIKGARQPFAQTFEEIKAWTEQHGRFPRQKSEDSLEQRLGKALINNRTTPSVIEWKESHPEYRALVPFEETFEQIKAWSEEHGRFPAVTSKDPVERRLGQALTSNRDIKQVQEWKDTHPEYRNYVPFHERFEQIKEWSHQRGRFPITTSEDQAERILGLALARNSDNPSVIEWKRLHPQYRNVVPFEETFEEIKAWSKEHGRFPVLTSKDETEARLGQSLKSNRDLHIVRKWVEANPEYRQLVPFAETFEQIKAWSEEHGRFPVVTSKDPVERRLGQALANNRLNPSVIEWRESHPEYRNVVPFEETFEEIKAWSEEHGRFPITTSQDTTERRLGNSLRKKSTDPLVAEWMESHPEYRNVVPSEEVFEEYKAWSEEHGRFPSRKSKDETERRLGVANNSLVQEWKKDHPEYRRLVPFEETFEEIKAWSEEHGRFPIETSDDPIEKRLGGALTNNRTNPSVIEWKKDHPEYINKVALHTIEGLRELAESMGGKLLSTHYSSGYIDEKGKRKPTKLEWECSQGHRFFDRVDNIISQRGKWTLLRCPDKCPVYTKYGENKAKLYFEFYTGKPWPTRNAKKPKPVEGVDLVIGGSERELDGFCSNVETTYGTTTLAFEYHGKQHYAPTFGKTPEAREASYRKTVGLDLKKEEAMEQIRPARWVGRFDTVGPNGETAYRSSREPWLIVIPYWEEKNLKEYVKQKLLDRGVSVNEGDPGDLRPISFTHLVKLNDLKILAQKRGYELLSTKWSRKANLEFRCEKEGHGTFFLNQKDIQNPECGCPKCGLRSAKRRSSLLEKTK